jgi:hypothetical protein
MDPLKQIRENVVWVYIGVLVAILAGLGILKAFFTETWPWLAEVTDGWGFGLVAAAALAVAVYYGAQYYRYRRAARKLMWRYIIDVQDEQASKPGRGPGQSDEVKRGEASATKEWGDRIYREVLKLPPENEYR